MDLFSTHMHPFTCTDPAQWAVHTRSPIQRHKQKTKTTTAAITTPRWQRVVLTTMLIRLRSSWQRKCELLKWGEWKRREEGEDTRRQKKRTHAVHRGCTSSQRSVEFRADEPQSNPNGTRPGNHLLFNEGVTFEITKRWFWSRVWQWSKSNNPPIIF